MLHIGLTTYESWKFKHPYILLQLCSVFVSTKQQHTNENTDIDFDVYDLPEIKEWDRCFIFKQFLYFNLPESIQFVIYLSFVIIYGYLLKYIAVTT